MHANLLSGVKKLLRRGPVARLFKALTYIVAGIYFIYRCYVERGHPVMATLETCALLLLTHLLHDLLADSKKAKEEEIMRVLDTALKPVFGLVNQLLETQAQTQELLDSLLEKQAITGVRAMHIQMPLHRIINSARSGEIVYIYDTFIPGIDDYVSDFNRAVARGVRFRFLTLHPKSPVFKDRVSEITRPNFIPFPKYYREINHCDDQIKQFVIAAPQNVERRYYETMPNQPLYLIEDRDGCARCAYQSFFLIESSVTTPHLEWVRNGPESMLSLFHQYLQEKWKRCENSSERNKHQQLDKSAA